MRSRWRTRVLASNVPRVRKTMADMLAWPLEVLYAIAAGTNRLVSMTFTVSLTTKQATIA